MSSVRVAFAGTPEFAVPTLRNLATSGLDVVGVLTQPDRPKGRGRHPAASPVKAVALELGIAVEQPTSLSGARARAVLEGWRPDLLVVVAYGLILPTELLQLPPLGCVNIHASLLPRWRGAAPVQRAILAGDTTTGVTIMRMEAGLDTGPIYRQGVVPIRETDTAGSLLEILADCGASALIGMLPELISGRCQPVAQPAEDVSYARKLEKSEAVIDWALSAREISRRIRAFDPWPVAESSMRTEQVKLRTVSIKEEDSTGTAGRVLTLCDAGLIVQCGRGSVAIGHWQRPGRRSLPAARFAQGAAVVGEILGSAP